MNTLAIDTSTEMCSAAVLKDGEVLSEESLKVAAGHSGTILKVIDGVIAHSGCRKSSLDMIAVGLGPGSFTGIRIGIATAKGLAAGIGCSLRGICTLDAIAANVLGRGLPVMPVLDARKGEIFCALYNVKGSNLIPPVNIEPSQVKDIVFEPTLFAGNALAIYGSRFEELLGGFYRAADEGLWHPRASVVGRLAGDPSVARTEIIPVYVRASDAVMLLKKASSQ